MTFNFYSEYKKNSKEFQLEEPFDFFVFRPLAFIILKLTSWSTVRPNHFSLISLVIAFSSGFLLSTGSAQGFILAGIGVFIFSILDCCDGMLARMKRNGSKYGDLIDMFADLLANIAIYIGLFIGLSKSSEYFPIHYLALVSAFFIFLHASFYNFYKKQFSFYQANNPLGRAQEIEQYKADLKKLNKDNGSYFDRLLLNLFLLFSRAQKNPIKVSSFETQKYVQYNKPILPMWGVISGSSHLMILSLALITHRIGLYFLFSIILANLWLIFVAMVQVGVNGSLARER